MARVLVTGATGFIGLHLVESLVDSGQRVRCLVRASSRTERLCELGVELITAEFDQPQALAAAASDVDVVYHLAGVTRTICSDQFLRANGEAAGQLAAACAAQPRPPRLVLVSSIAAADPVPRGQTRLESDAPAPVSRYGESKLAGERAAEKFAAEVPLTIVRPGVVFGPRDPSFLKILKTIRVLNCHPTPGFRPPALSYIHVADLVELLRRAADRGGLVPAKSNGQPGKGRYFAVATEYPNYAELGRMARTMLARPNALVIPVAAPLVWCLAGMSECLSRLQGDPQELSFDKMREALAPSWACSGEAAKRDLGFAPAKSLAERLQETIDWYLAQGWL